MTMIDRFAPAVLRFHNWAVRKPSVVMFAVSSLFWLVPLLLVALLVGSFGWMLWVIPAGVAYSVFEVWAIRNLDPMTIIQHRTRILSKLRFWA